MSSKQDKSYIVFKIHVQYVWHCMCLYWYVRYIVLLYVYICTVLMVAWTVDVMYSRVQRFLNQRHIHMAGETQYSGEYTKKISFILVQYKLANSPKQLAISTLSLNNDDMSRHAPGQIVRLHKSKGAEYSPSPPLLQQAVCCRERPKTLDGRSRPAQI